VSRAQFGKTWKRRNSRGGRSAPSKPSSEEWSNGIGEKKDWKMVGRRGEELSDSSS